jgi:hypothetical protein
MATAVTGGSGDRHGRHGDVPPPAARQTRATRPRTIDADDPADLARWAQRLGVDVEAVRNAVIAVGPTVTR